MIRFFGAALYVPTNLLQAPHVFKIGEPISDSLWKQEILSSPPKKWFELKYKWISQNTDKDWYALFIQK